MMQKKTVIKKPPRRSRTVNLPPPPTRHRIHWALPLIKKTMVTWHHREAQ
jgi:hypothetical protein